MLKSIEELSTYSIRRKNGSVVLVGSSKAKRLPEGGIGSDQATNVEEAHSHLKRLK